MSHVPGFQSLDGTYDTHNVATAVATDDQKLDRIDSMPDHLPHPPDVSACFRCFQHRIAYYMPNSVLPLCLGVAMTYNLEPR